VIGDIVLCKGGRSLK